MQDKRKKRNLIKGDLKENKNRNFSKLCLDYMLYLLVMQPNMMSAVGGFRGTCVEANNFFHREKVEHERGFCFLLKRKGGKLEKGSKPTVVVEASKTGMS
ncbi:hypothetical protein LguiA_022098 [Lonicera macranthoides]